MTIYDKPQPVAFAADLIDFKLDSDKSIAFAVRKANRLILSEDYAPGADFMIRTRKLGKVCANALWGLWPVGDVTVQDKIADTFDFLIDGTVSASSYIIASHCRQLQTPQPSHALTLARGKMTRAGAHEWVTVLLTQGATATVSAVDDAGGVHNSTLYTQSAARSVVTIDVSPSRIAGLFPTYRIIQYSVCGLTFRIDQTQYLEQHCFRFFNNFECPEAVSATGSLTVQASEKSETAYMDGVERKFRVTPADEYTVNSGVIFTQAEYKIWHELLHSRRVQMLVDDQWVDIIISKSKYQRNFKKNILKSVEFSFRFADPDDNTLL